MSRHRMPPGILPCSQPVSTEESDSLYGGGEEPTSAKLRPSKASSVGWGGGSCPNLKEDERTRRGVRW